MSRREKTRIVAGRVAERISEATPSGLGHWGPVWGLVATPSDAYMDALADWEAEDSILTRLALEAASNDLAEAWTEAGRQWEAAGRPTHDASTIGKVEADVGELVL
jgi:hypothetical protein